MTSCVKEDFGTSDSVVEGQPAVIRLGYGSQSSEIIMTKGVMTELDEDRVNSLRVLVFDANTGSLVTDHTFVGDALKGKSASDNYSSGYVELATTSGKRKVFGIANSVNNADFTIDLSNVKSINDLEKLTVTQNNAIISRGANFLMSGWYNDKSVMEKTSDADLLATIITIPAGNSTEEHKRIKLSRLDAKVEFEFVEGQSIDFTPLSYAVYNVPKMSYLCGYDDETGAAAALGQGYAYNTNSFTSTAANFDNATNSKAFGFYMMESNLLHPERSASTFAQRDLKDKGDANTLGPGNANDNGIYDGTGAADYVGGEWNGEWAYANKYSTYVQIKGRIEYPSGNDFISADVIYNIHLGNFGDSADGGGNGYNDFSTRRNTHYTYTVTVNGANDIRVEVENKNEQMPAAEGTVVIANGQIYTVDSHYSSRILEFSKTDFTSEDDIKNLTWYVSTPYSSGMPDNERNYENTLDFKWVEFYPHTSAITSTDSYTSYINYLKDLGATDDTLDDYRIYVDDLVGKLKAWYMGTSGNDFEGADAVYVTAFVNEFYYEKGTGNAPSGGSGTADELRDMWKKVVNADDRYLHILCDVHHSVDGSSLSMGSAYSIFQHSIQTIYNTDASLTDLKYAWGTEMINEEKTDEITALYGTDNVDGRLYGLINSTSTNHTFNGRYNTATIWGNSQAWSASSNSKLKESYYGPILRSTDLSTSANPAIYSCMTRNRDNDGNGVLDYDEMHWYLAAIDQYLGIHIGEQGLNKDARLYSSDAYEKNAFHYISSTVGLYNNKTNGGTIFWAEEACATSPGDVNWRGEAQQYAIRCLRNLGADTDAISTMGSAVQHYSTIQKLDDGTAAITSNYLNTQSMRAKTYAEGEQYPIGDEFSEQNRPHVQFIIASDNSSYETTGNWGGTTTQKSYTYSDVKDFIESGDLTKVCPDGYRVPYARELALMFVLNPSDADNNSHNGEFIDWSNDGNTNAVETYWLSCTYSKFGYYGDKTYYDNGRLKEAIAATGNNTITLNNLGDSGIIRCVKDNINYAPQTPAMTLNDGGSGI